MSCTKQKEFVAVVALFSSFFSALDVRTRLKTPPYRYDCPLSCLTHALCLAFLLSLLSVARATARACAWKYTLR
jgi:hypothetical protein